MSVPESALRALAKICEHKEADPAGTLVLYKSLNQAKILRGQQIDEAVEGETFALTESDYNTLINAGFIRQAPDALDRPDAPTAFDVTTVGWEWYLASQA